MKIERAIISGGGTGGHIFPAIAIADEIKRRNPNAEILFVGAEGKMEMVKVPEAGYKIVGLQIVGLKRQLTLSNLSLPFKIIKSLLKARKIIKNFKPQVVVGVGGYASGPTLKMSTLLKIPSMIQEQNSYPGKTNKILAKSVQKICVAYEGLEKFFPADKISITGNPIREEMVQTEGKKEEAIKHFGLDKKQKTILVIGGSLGAKTINDSVYNKLEELKREEINVIWQSGKLYFDKLNKELQGKTLKNIKLLQFIRRMDLAYAAADIVISRAGAISVSELCLVQKPTILVPSPNVAEDHQTKNALTLVKKNAAVIVKDNKAFDNLIEIALELTKNEMKCKELSDNISYLGKPNATSDIVNELEKII